MVKYKLLLLSLLYLTATANSINGQVTEVPATKTALIIVDIQNDYFDGGANPLVGSLEASLKAKSLLEFFRSNSLPVIHVQHLSSRVSTFFKPETNGVAIHSNVSPAPGEQLIIKHYPNSFRETELLDYLKSNRITDLVICGMMTHMCIDATVRAAKDYGYNCILIGDACATKDLEVNGKTVKASDVQTAFLSALNYYYCKVMTLDEYRATQRL